MEWHDNHLFPVRSDHPGKNDKFSGVKLHINKRIAKYSTDSGSIGSRIAFCRLSGQSYSVFVVGVYIPRRGRTNPDQNEIYNKLESFLYKISIIRLHNNTVG